MRRLLVLLSLVIVLIPLPARAQQNDFTAGQLVLVSIDRASIVDAPAFNATPVATVAAGEELHVLADEPVETDGTFWWNVRSLDRGVSGWLPDRVLEPKFFAAAADPGKRGAGACEGLDDYAAAYLRLFTISGAAHPEALEILEATPPSTTDYVGYIESLPAADLLVLEDFYLALAEAMDGVAPPAFAQTWHELQQDSLELSGDIFGDAATMGIMEASTLHSPRTFEILERVGPLLCIAESMPILSDLGPCPNPAQIAVTPLPNPNALLSCSRIWRVPHSRAIRHTSHTSMSIHGIAKELFVRRIFLVFLLCALELTPMGVTPLLAQGAEFTIGEVLVAIDEANMRTEPGTDSEIVSTLMRAMRCGSSMTIPCRRITLPGGTFPTTRSESRGGWSRRCLPRQAVS